MEFLVSIPVSRLSMVKKRMKLWWWGWCYSVIKFALVSDNIGVNSLLVRAFIHFMMLLHLCGHVTALQQIPGAHDMMLLGQSQATVAWQLTNERPGYKRASLIVDWDNKAADVEMLGAVFTMPYLAFHLAGGASAWWPGLCTSDTLSPNWPRCDVTQHRTQHYRTIITMDIWWVSDIGRHPGVTDTGTDYT